MGSGGIETWNAQLPDRGYRSLLQYWLFVYHCQLDDGMGDMNQRKEEGKEGCFG